MGERIDCEAVHARIRTGATFEDAPDADRLAAHLASCPACAELAADGARLGRTLVDDQSSTQPRLSLADLDALYDALEPDLRPPREPAARLRQSPTWLRKLILGAVASATVALVLAAMARVDLGVYPLPRLLGSVAALLLAVLAAGAVVLRPLHRRPPPDWLLGIVAGLAVVAPAVVCSLPAAHRDHPDSLAGAGADLVPRALGCFVFGTSFALALVAAAWLVERSGLRRRGPTVMTLLGAGALGNLLLVLHCPLVEPVHKLAGHASVSLVLLLGAAVLVWRRLT